MKNQAMQISTRSLSVLAACKNLSFLILFSILLAGCATRQALYERPLHDIGLLDGQQERAWKIEEISHEELASIKPGQRPPVDSDEAGLWMIMDQAEEGLRTSGHLVYDRALQGYLQGIACRLAPEYCNDIRIYLVRVPYFNASMAPNGGMQIWTGLLLRVQNEAQLAAVIGHELGHYLRRHSLQQMRQVIRTSDSLVFVQLATALAGLPQAGYIIQALAMGNILAYSRDHEREADGYGLALLARAGYDPRESAKVWKFLLEEKRADKDHVSYPVFLATHPLSEERYEALLELGERLAAKKGSWELGQETFFAHVSPHLNVYLKDELHLRDFTRTEKLLDMLLARSAKPAELHFYKGELYRLRGAPKDNRRALTEYEKAELANGEPPPELYRSRGLLLRKFGQPRAAAKDLRMYLQVRPESGDRMMIRHMLEELE
jgi:Zn-dependent protease with chaperone function